MMSVASCDYKTLQGNENVHFATVILQAPHTSLAVIILFTAHPITLWETDQE
ncbi:MAG: hypothetical protein AAF902_09940 [Chloroflexota bacterium]